MATKLKSLTIKGFKTIRILEDWEPAPINVLIGANGAGKSNFISFFRLMSWMLAAGGNLQEHVALQGGARTFLYDGPEVTRDIEAHVTLETERGENEYRFRLAWAADDMFVFTDERYRYSSFDHPGKAEWRSLGAGHREPRLIEQSKSEDRTARTILALLRQCVVHQFHNTSGTARIRGKWDANDSRWLKEDAGNLGSFLLRLQEEEGPHYNRIVKTLRMMLPFFDDFELASDGMLRSMALVSLLAQPEKDLPGILILDEPELGLNPYAITVVAGMLRSVSASHQVIVATQSETFVDHFEPEDVVVVDRAERNKGSQFQRLDSERLKDWLDEYSLSELWEKNVLRGRPSR